VQAGVWKRLGKRLATGCSYRSSSGPTEGEYSLGAGDGTVAMGASTTGDGRGAAGISSRTMCSLRSCPRCWWTKESWVGAGRSVKVQDLDGATCT